MTMLAASSGNAQDGGLIPQCPVSRMQVGSASASPEASVVLSAPEPAVTLLAADGELTVFAAASLRGAFEASEPMYEALSGLDLVYSFDASSFLRTQIEEGAPADVFASADTVNAEALLDAGLASDPVAFACNELTIIVPAANPAGIDTFDDIADRGVRVIAAGEAVPITRYATQLVDALGIADGYAANIVSEEDNVAAVRAKVELGEGDAAIVYVTDAMASGQAVIEIGLPPEVNVSATYAAVVVAGTDQVDESRAFLEWLIGPGGQAGLSAFGFLPAPGDP
jgi:molybdate transport system substrate-binding protein